VKTARFLVLFLAGILLANSALAQTPIVLQGVQDGSYVLTVKGGQVTITPAIVVTPGGPVIPVPPVPPVVPPTPSTKSDQIKAAAVAVSDPQKATTATNLASLMGMIESQINAGTIKDYQTISATVNWMWDQITAGRVSNWKPVKDLIGNHLMAMAQEGATPEEYSGYFADAADAISAAVPVSYEADEDKLNINIAMLMQLFEFFIKYILPMIIK
jgi:hypothetical protein